jgi:hypothetical protein
MEGSFVTKITRLRIGLSILLTISIDNRYFLGVDITQDRGRCPTCRATLLFRGAEEVVIRNAILKVDGPSGRVTAKCPRCKGWVEVPLKYVG